MTDVKATHGDKVLSMLNELRLSNELCDVMIKVEETEIPAHKTVLAAACLYFRGMFSTELMESKADSIVLKQLNPEAVARLIEYIYTGNLVISEDIACDLLHVADVFRLDHAKDLCSVFIELRLNASNCLGILAFADSHNCVKLKEASEHVAQSYFNAVVSAESGEFLKAPFSYIKDLLSNDEVLVDSEEKIFEAMLEWVSHDETRQLDLPELLKCVRLAFVPPSYLVLNISNNPLIKSNPTCQELVSEAKDYHLLSLRPGSAADVAIRRLPVHPEEETEKQIVKPLHSPRRGTPKGFIYILGGHSERFNVESTVEVYYTLTNDWSSLPDMPIQRYGAGGAILDSFLYVIGGVDGRGKSLSAVDQYNPRQRSWTSVQPMLEMRSYVGVAVLRNKIYSCGGFDGSRSLNTVECYDGATWQAVPPMISKRSGLGAAVADDVLFAVGGKEQNNFWCTVEMFEPDQQKWSLIDNMDISRYGCGVGVVAGLLYIVGGCNSPTNILDTVERYNPRSGNWCTIAPLHQKRIGVSVTVVDDTIFAIGGHDGYSRLGTCEQYDPKTDTWTQMCSMSKCKARYWAGAASA